MQLQGKALEAAITVFCNTIKGILIRLHHSGVLVMGVVAQVITWQQCLDSMNTTWITTLKDFQHHTTLYVQQFNYFPCTQQI